MRKKKSTPCSKSRLRFAWSHCSLSVAAAVTTSPTAAAFRSPAPPSVKNGGNRLRSKVLVLLLALCFYGVAQQSSPSEGSSAPSSQTQPAHSQSQPIETGQPRLSKSQAKQALGSPDFTPQVAQALLERLADGLETHNASKTGSVFDPTAFDSQFFDRMNAAFDHFETFNVYRSEERRVGKECRSRW